MSDDEPFDDIDAALARLFEDAASEAERASLDDVLALFDATLDVDMLCGMVDRSDELVAVRSTATLDARQVVVHGSLFDVVLDVTPAGTDRVDVRGTVLGAEGCYGVQLLDGAEEVALTATDELGEFVLVDIGVGRYELVVAARGGARCRRLSN